MKKLTLIFCLLIANTSIAETVYCKVVAVVDGDTIKCLTDNKEQLKIKLYQIDAPKKNQAFGNKSKQALSDLIFNKNVLIYTQGKDKYKRTLATIYDGRHFDCKATASAPCITLIDYIDINLEMIKQGMAWYWPFAKKNDEYKKAKEQAKLNKVGLWGDKNPVAPWTFGKNKINN